MRALLCIVCPPLAILLHGKPISAFFNVFLCLFGWFPGVIHAMTINDQAHTSKQTKQIVGAIKGPKKRKKKPCPVHNERRMERLYGKNPTESYNDALIGEGGTKFKRKV